jgi:hypothetical protein
MKRSITNDDLAALVTKASTLRKLAQSAKKISADLDVEEGYMKVADKSIGRGHALLQNRALRPKQRAKVEEQLESRACCRASNWPVTQSTTGILMEHWLGKYLMR